MARKPSTMRRRRRAYSASMTATDPWSRDGFQGGVLGDDVGLEV